MKPVQLPTCKCTIPVVVADQGKPAVWHCVTCKLPFKGSPADHCYEIGPMFLVREREAVE